ncbi:hypothetical protein [Litorisediminicola beolgyonensis]|uniref:Uncharacterized protein n=1 Tax=Litorisediminicola beolgyonensis TaxID=1173614 RepID=A0ABW3ZDU2_9RHOB
MTRADPSRSPPEAARYFDAFAEGRWDDDAQLGYIYPQDRARLAEDGSVLIVGTAGVDGLEFAIRDGHPKVWVFYPLDAEWRQVALDIDTLDRAWRDRTLSL